MRFLPERFGSLIVVVCHSLPGASSDQEDPTCPCIDPWTGGVLANFTFWNGTTQCLSYRRSASQQPFCYPIGYGARGCDAYDAGLPPDCVGDGTYTMVKSLPRFCTDPWCYVDKSNCNLGAQPSNYFRGVNLSYSYATCGSVNSFQTQLLVNTLKGRTLRVGVPSMEHPYLSRDAAGILDGITPAFLAHVAADGGFTLSFGLVFNDSKALYPKSSYTACVRDVALQRFDMCVGTFWETPQRRALTQFSPLLFPEMFVLVVYKHDKQDSLSIMIQRVFKPFSAELWGILLGLTFVVGFVMWLFGEFDQDGVVNAIILAQFLSILRILGQASWGRLHTMGSGFVATGFGFVCMVCLCSYTANTAAMLVSADVLPDYENIEDALKSGARICVLEPLSGAFVAKYPLAADLVVVTEWFNESIIKMDAGECDAMLMNGNEYSRMHGGVDYYGTGPRGKAAHCNKIEVGPVVLTISAAMPVHNDVSFAIGYLVSKASASGMWETAAMKYVLQPDRCSKADIEKRTRPLSVKDLSGALMVCFVLLIAGIILHITEPTIERYIKRKISERKKKEESESCSIEEDAQSGGSIEQKALQQLATMANHLAQWQNDFAEMQQAEARRLLRERDHKDAQSDLPGFDLPGL